MQALSIQLPKQDRSRRTLHSILQTTRDMLNEQTFDAIAVSQIVARSGTSNGSFFARFPDKASLLSALQADAHEDIVGRLKTELAPEAWAALSLPETVRGIIPILMKIPDEHLPVFKAAMMSSFTSQVIARRVTQIIDRKVELTVALVLSKRTEIRHANPDHAAISGARIIEAVLQHRRVRLFVDTIGYPVDEEHLCDDLAEMYLSLLAIDHA